MVIKKFNCLELAQKIMQVEVNVLSMHINFDGCRHSGFGDIATFKNGQISLSHHGLCSPWSSKKLIIWNRLKKFMQVEVNVLCMHTNFDGCHHSGFGDKKILSKTAKIPFPIMDYIPWSSKNLITWNRLKKFMQVEVNVLCMHTNFDGCHHSGFGDIATFKNGQISLSINGL